MWLVRLSLERPVFVLMLTLLTLVMGVLGYVKIAVDLFPEIEPPIITVTTTYEGAGPEEIETLISKPIEEEINQIGGIERLNSTSREGISQVVVEFRLEMDAKEAAMDVRDKLSRVRPSLPEDVDEPIVRRLDFTSRPILKLALRQDQGVTDPSQRMTEGSLRLYAEQQVKQKIQQVEGVGQVDVFGGLEREISVDLDLQKLLALRLTPLDVANAIKGANLNVPGGELDEEPRRRSLRVIGEARSVTELENTVVRNLPGGRSLRVTDVGMVRDTFKERTSFARLDGEPVVTIEIRKQSGANTVHVTDAVLASMTEINANLPQGAEIRAVYDGARQVRMALHDVMETLVIAALAAFVVVYFFLGSWQSTIITGIALPTSCIATMFALYQFGFTLNTMTLLGLTLAVGLILDDAIVVRENIWAKIEEGMAPKQAAYEGSKQVVVAVIATSLTVIATFLPVTLIPGIVGKFFSAFALTVCIGVAFSTFDALTMAPMLSAYLVRSPAGGATPKQHGHAPNRVLQVTEAFGERFARAYKHVLHWCIHHPKTVLATAALLFVSSLGLLKMIGFTFLPASEYGELEIGIEAPQGSSLETTNRIMGELERTAASYGEVAYTTARVGSELGDKNTGALYVRLKESGERKATTSDMKTEFRRAVSEIAARESMTFSVRDPGGGGPGRPVTVVVQGPDTGKLIEISNEVVKKLPGAVPEVTNLESNLKPGKEELQYRVLRDRAAGFGLSVTEVGQFLRGLYAGELAGVFREAGEEYDIRVQLRKQDKQSTYALDKLSLPNSRGESIALDAVAERRQGVAPTSIVRINQMRAAMLEGDLAEGAALAGALGKFSDFVKPMLPAGYTLDFQGQAKSLKDLAVGAVIALTLGILFIYMIMASLYESFIMPFTILLTLPLAIVGALAAMLATGKFLDIYSIIGMILLMGLVTKNAILLVDYVEQLRRDGHGPYEALMESGARRLRPIMMTTVAMIAGLMPVALGYGELNKVRMGMGIAAIGGLVSSTMLSLIVVPCAYVYLDRFRDWCGSLVARFRGNASPQADASRGTGKT